jgi:hypothetical protein
MGDELNSNPDELILWFDDFGAEPTNSYRFLSNFYVGEPILIRGARFQTGEHAFQAAKARTLKAHDMVRTADDPGHAKSLGRSIPLREDWEAVKYDVMAIVLRAKFAPDRSEADLLLSTGDALLVEGTYWGDQVWGVDLKPYEARRDPTAFGRNWLGTLLMARRAELRYEVRTGQRVHTHGPNLTFAWPFLGEPVGR